MLRKLGIVSSATVLNVADVLNFSLHDTTPRLLPKTRRHIPAALLQLMRNLLDLFRAQLRRAFLKHPTAVAGAKDVDRAKAGDVGDEPAWEGEHRLDFDRLGGGGGEKLGEPFCLALQLADRQLDGAIGKLDAVVGVIDFRFRFVRAVDRFAVGLGVDRKDPGRADDDVVDVAVGKLNVVEDAIAEEHQLIELFAGEHLALLAQLMSPLRFEEAGEVAVEVELDAEHQAYHRTDQYGSLRLGGEIAQAGVNGEKEDGGDDEENLTNGNLRVEVEHLFTNRVTRRADHVAGEWRLSLEPALPPAVEVARRFGKRDPEAHEQNGDGGTKGFPGDQRHPAGAPASILWGPQVGRFGVRHWGYIWILQIFRLNGIMLMRVRTIWAAIRRRGGAVSANLHAAWRLQLSV